MISSKLEVATVGTALLVLTLGIGPNTATGSEQNKHIRTLSGVEITTTELDAFLHDQMDSRDIKGLAIAVINEDEIVYHRTFGFSDVASQKKVDDQTLFEAASLSKPLFAYFVMKMVEKGTLDLDTPLYK